MERSHIIPAMTTNSEPLEIQHDCTYLVHMHSIPYPYGDPNFATGIKYMVPTCIEGYCNCASMLSIYFIYDISKLLGKFILFFFFVKIIKFRSKCCTGS